MPIKTTLPAAERDEPRFHWIGVYGHEPYLKIFRVHEHRDGLNEFLDSVLDATRRVWILDKYFDVEYGLKMLWSSLKESAVREVRIISDQKTQLDQWIHERGATAKRPQTRLLGWLINAKHIKVHDRFALVDNDLWHFGSTVGGRYPGLSAATHGWHTQIPVMEHLFEDLWRGRYAR